MLSVSGTWGVSLFHNCSGKLLSVVANAGINAALNVWIACLVAFTWWLCGSTTCSMQSFLLEKFFNVFCCLIVHDV
jgi:hypothetical protein